MRRAFVQASVAAIHNGHFFAPFSDRQSHTVTSIIFTWFISLHRVAMTESSVRVGVRVRPLVSREKGQGITIDSSDNQR